MRLLYVRGSTEASPVCTQRIAASARSPRRRGFSASWDDAGVPELSQRLNRIANKKHRRIQCDSHAIDLSFGFDEDAGLVVCSFVFAYRPAYISADSLRPSVTKEYKPLPPWVILKG